MKLFVSPHSEGDDLNAVFDAAFGFLEKEESSDDEEDEEGENWEPNSSTVSEGVCVCRGGSE